MPSIVEVIRLGARILSDAGVPDAGRDARRIMGYVMGLDGAALFAAERDLIEDRASAEFDRLVARRAGRQPLAQITGQRDFFGRIFTVTPDVLDPRPETETLVGLALAEPFKRVLDLGTGSGAILITLLAEQPGAGGVGTDISGAALAVAGENALRHGVDGRIVLPISDWWADVGGLYDLVVSNPPYVAPDEIPALAPEVRDWEPRIALTDGVDGLQAYRSIAPGAARHLVPGGRILLEIGPSQGAAVSGILRREGFVEVAVHGDLDGRDRVVSGRMPRL